MKNEKALLELINATVSHEIRNPLNSLMAQQQRILKHNQELKKFIAWLKSKDSLSEDEMKSVVGFLETHLEEESEACMKMHSANKFIDFFVHDILDFSVLNQNE